MLSNTKRTTTLMDELTIEGILLDLLHNVYHLHGKKMPPQDSRVLSKGCQLNSLALITINGCIISDWGMNNEVLQ